MLAYGVPGCSVDEYTMVRKSTIIQPFRAFIMVVVHVFVDKYLKAPNAEDSARCNECLYLRWKNCTIAWKWHYEGRAEGPTMIFEVVHTP
jgi:hypothetical protein